MTPVHHPAHLPQHSTYFSTALFHISATTLSQTNTNKLPIDSWHILHYKGSKFNLPPTTLAAFPMLYCASNTMFIKEPIFNMGLRLRVVGGRLALLPL